MLRRDRERDRWEGKGCRILLQVFFFEQLVSTEHRMISGLVHGLRVTVATGTR